MTDKPDDETGALLTTGFVARRLGISRQTIRVWCDKGAIKAHLILGRYWIPKVELERLEREGEPKND